MKAMAISIFILVFFSSASSALDFSLASPDSVQAEAEFTITIGLNEEPQGTYDVKAFVHRHTKEFSEIYYNGQWKSPFNYLSSAFPQQTQFKLRSHFVGETKVCARLRASGDSAFTEKCNTIKILPQENSNTSGEETGDENGESERENITERKNILEINQAGENKAEKQIIKKEQPAENERIILSFSDNKKEEEFVTKNGKLERGIIYSFMIFALILIILLALKRL